MGFMAGFANAATKGIQDYSAQKAERENDIFKYSFQSFLNKKEELTKREEREAEYVASAKSFAEVYKQPADSWQKIYEWKKAGWSDAQIGEVLETQTITSIAPVAKAADAQSVPDPMSTQMANIGLDTAPMADPQARMKKDYDSNVKRIAEITGEAPEDVSRTLSGGRSKPSINSDGKAGSFKLVDKDVPVGKLTDAEIISRHANLIQAAEKGEPGAAEKLKAFEEVTLPAYRSAKQAIEIPTGDSRLPDLLYRAKQAREAGNTEEYGRLSERIKAEQMAISMRNPKAGGPEFFTGAALLPNGKVEVTRVKPVTDEDGNTTYVDLRGNSVGSSVDRLDEYQLKQIDNLTTTRMNEITKHEENLANAASAASLTKEAFDLIGDDNDPILTTAAGVAKTAVGVVREVQTGVDLVTGIMEKQGGASAEEVENILGPRIASVEKAIDSGALSEIEALAARRSLLDSKLLLAAFRVGALEGQSGAGMSNQDYSRVQEILDASSNPAVFKKNWSDYMAGRFANVDARAEIANNFNTALNNFEKQNGFRPFDTVVTGMSDYAARTTNEKVRDGYGLIEEYSNQTFNPMNAPKTGFGTPKAPAQTQTSSEPQFLGSKNGYDYFMVNGVQKRRKSQ